MPDGLGITVVLALIGALAFSTHPSGAGFAAG
jgi:hypothetical protein